MGQTAEAAAALYEGIPPWMERELWDWLDARLVKESHVHDGFLRDVAFVDRFDRLTRSTNPVADYFRQSGSIAFRDVWTAPWGGYTDSLLVFLDYCIASENRSPNASNADLETLLYESGSAWKVGSREGFAGLERRMPLGVQEASEETMRTTGRAGERLSEAWHAVYGVKPNPIHAYAMAVKAVEDATIPVVVPKQSGATLSHVIGQLKNSGDWSLPLTREHPDAPTSETVLRMIQGLWKGHHDRHGGDPTAPKSVGQDEAEAAVMLAVPLVQWFTSGAVARR